MDTLNESTGNHPKIVSPAIAPGSFSARLRGYSPPTTMPGSGVYVPSEGYTLVDIFGRPEYRALAQTAKDWGARTGEIPVLSAQGLFQLHTYAEIATLGRRAVSPAMEGISFLTADGIARSTSAPMLEEIRRWSGLKPGSEHLVDSYGNRLGFDPVREEWAKFAHGILGVPQVRYENTMITDGGSAGAIAFVALSVFRDQQGPLAVFNPRFPGYLSPQASYMKPLVNKLILLNTERSGLGFVDDLDDVKRMLENHRPKLLIISNPDNPTGRTRDAANLMRLIELCEQNKCHLHIEWTYSTMLFNGAKFVGLPEALTEFPAHVTASASTSKVHQQSSLRGAAIYGAPATIARLGDFVNDVNICPSAEVQVKSAALLASNGRDYYDAVNRAVEDRRRIVAAAYGEVGFQVYLPPATGYALVRDPGFFRNLDSTIIARHLAKNGLAIAPGTQDFGLPPGYFRVSLVRPESELELTRARLKQSWPALEELSASAFDIVGTQ